jgi:hypothetical protein
VKPRTDLGSGLNWWLDDGGLLFVRHEHPAGSPHPFCSGILSQHTIHSTDPLDVDPSLVMPCGAHGWVHGGKWTDA